MQRLVPGNRLRVLETEKENVMAEGLVKPYGAAMASRAKVLDDAEMSAVNAGKETADETPALVRKPVSVDEANAMLVKKKASDAEFAKTVGMPKPSLMDRVKKLVGM
jgi:hypothetical protein